MTGTSLRRSSFLSRVQSMYPLVGWASTHTTIRSGFSCRASAIPFSLFVAVNALNPPALAAAASPFAKDSSESMSRIRLGMTPSKRVRAAPTGVNESCRGLAELPELHRLHELQDVALVEIGDERIHDLVRPPGNHIVAAAPTEPHLAPGKAAHRSGRIAVFGVVDDEQRDAVAFGLRPGVGERRRRAGV